MFMKCFLLPLVALLGATATFSMAQPSSSAVAKELVVLGFKLHYTEEQVRGAKAPVLIIWGKYDGLANPAGADRLEKAIPGSRKVVIDDCGHMPQLEKAGEFNRIVRDFLLGQRHATHQ